MSGQDKKRIFNSCRILVLDGALNSWWFPRHWFILRETIGGVYLKIPLQRILRKIESIAQFAFTHANGAISRLFVSQRVYWQRSLCGCLVCGGEHWFYFSFSRHCWHKMRIYSSTTMLVHQLSTYHKLDRRPQYSCHSKQYFHFIRCVEWSNSID